VIVNMHGRTTIKNVLQGYEWSVRYGSSELLAAMAHKLYFLIWPRVVFNWSSRNSRKLTRLFSFAGLSH
jgi:hypothetical protein